MRHARCINREIAVAKAMDEVELYTYAKDLQVPYDLLKKTAQMGRLPVVNFAAGGIGNVNVLKGLMSNISHTLFLLVFSLCI